MREVVAAVHGGNLADIARRYGIREERLLDFSANVNPLGPPRPLVRAFVRAARDREALSRYPDDGHAGLTQALAQRLRVDPASIVIANGAAALLDAAVRVRSISRCLLPVPAFSEDRRALDAARVPVTAFSLPREAGFHLSGAAAIDAMRRAGCDALLVTNPHNPSGTLASREAMADLAAAARACGALAIVDEAFVDFVPDASIARVAATESSTIVIRSLTKFFGVPALRVGYAVCEPDLARRLRAILPPWPVTSAAARALAAALADAAYARRTPSTAASASGSRGACAGTRSR